MCFVFTSFGKVVRTQSPPQVKRVLEPPGAATLVVQKLSLFKWNQSNDVFPTWIGRILLVLDIHICAHAPAEILGRFHDSWGFPITSRQSGHGKTLNLYSMPIIKGRSMSYPTWEWLGLPSIVNDLRERSSFWYCTCIARGNTHFQKDWSLNPFKIQIPSYS